jgi:hypothetical protein
MIGGTSFKRRDEIVINKALKRVCRRHYMSNKIYYGVSKEGKTSKVVWAYTKAEAAKEIRKTGFRSIKGYEA